MPSQRQPERLRRQRENRSTPKAAHILVVDDFRDNREMYADYLRFCGYTVDEAVNGREAVDRARGDHPDLIVMDLSLPVMDGWQATRILKADPQTEHIPVIALTGHALRQTEASVLAAGADAYLVKPCLPESLTAKIEGLLRAKGAARTA